MDARGVGHLRSTLQPTDRVPVDDRDLLLADSTAPDTGQVIESVGPARRERAAPCARTSLAEEEGGSEPKLQIATRGESPTGDDARSPRRKRVLRDRRMYTGDRDHEA